MSVHRSSSPSAPASRRAGRSRRRRRGRDGRAAALWVGLATGVVLTVTGGLVLHGLTDASVPPAAATSTEQAAPSADAEQRRSAGAERRGSADAEPPEPPSSSPSVSPSAIPSSGPGTFTTARGGGERVGGTARVLTYRVQVEDGIGLSPQDVAAEVEKILAHPRGWTADGTTGFRRVSGDTSDFRVRLATAGTVDDICGRYGLDTGGEVNCNVGQDVMVNLKRWHLATQYYADDIPAYRALIINHEVGHFLGHGHETCPGEGEPAPAMMQQIKGLRGCVPNVWPYDTAGRRITGPAVP